MRSLLKDLVSLHGPCGFEHDVARYLYNRLKDRAPNAFFFPAVDFILSTALAIAT